MKALYALVGMRYRGTDKIVKSLPSGTPVMLQREPLNQYDGYAIQVRESGRMLGYIKSNHAQQMLAKKMDSGWTTVPGKLVAGEYPMIEIDE